MVGKPGVVGQEDAPKRFTSCLSFIPKEDFLLEGGVEQRMKMTLGGMRVHVISFMAL